MLINIPSVLIFHHIQQPWHWKSLCHVPLTCSLQRGTGDGHGLLAVLGLLAGVPKLHVFVVARQVMAFL